MHYKYLLVDGPFLANRSGKAPYRLTTSGGIDSTMVHSFLRTMNSLRKKFSPSNVAVAWESHGTKPWRRDLYSSYKKKSTGCTESFWNEVRDIQIFLYLLSVKQYYSIGNEADDVIANLVSNGCAKSVIFTADKDLMQLVSENCHVYDGDILYDVKKVEKKYLVEPKKIPDLLAICGDKADNIDGIKSYGFRKASKLLEYYGKIEDIPDDSTIYKCLSKLILNKKLTTLNCKCQLEEIPSRNFKTNETLVSLLNKYELNSIKENISEYMLLGNANSKWFGEKNG
jgi:DNA polymerase-1